MSEVEVHWARANGIVILSSTAQTIWSMIQLADRPPTQSAIFILYLVARINSLSLLFIVDSTFKDRALFHNLAHFTGKTYWISVKILSYMYLWTEKSVLNFGSHQIRSLHPDSGYNSGSGSD